MISVADWQTEHFQDNNGRKQAHHPLDWTNTAFYVGLTKLAAMDDNQEYFEWLKEIGETREWMLHKRTYHADDHAVGQMYIELYRKYDDDAMIKPTIEQFEFILSSIQVGFKLEYTFPPGSMELV